MVILACLMAYVVGAIPTGYWFCRYLFGVNITQEGSGNIGASNVARVFGLRYFVPIFVIDAGKAYATLCLCDLFVGSTLIPVLDCSWLYACAMLLLIGNAYSMFLHFKGGRGVATFVGIVAYLLCWQSLLVFMISWGVIVVVSKKPFVASLVSITLVTLMDIYLFYGTHIIFLLFMCAWLALSHRHHVLQLVRFYTRGQNQKDSYEV
jgi:acyl phosphate:glycerol-3-phosphate acyltransferase